MIPALSALIASRYELLAQLAELETGLDAERAARTLSERIVAGEREAALAAVTLAWGDGSPPSDWWASPIGVAITLAGDQAAIPVARAAAILGVSHQRAHQLASSLRLQRHPDGGVTVTSVRALILERARAELRQLPMGAETHFTYPDEDGTHRIVAMVKYQHFNLLPMDEPSGWYVNAAGPDGNFGSGDEERLPLEIDAPHEAVEALARNMVAKWIARDLERGVEPFDLDGISARDRGPHGRSR